MESTRPPTGRTQIEQVQNQVNQELPTWLWVLLVVLFVAGWVTDTPATMLKGLKKKG